MTNPTTLTWKTARQELRSHRNARAAAGAQTFFKTAKGQYGEGDLFHGIKVAVIRSLAKKFRALPLSQLKLALESPYNDERQFALFVLHEQFKAATPIGKKEITKFYLQHKRRVNNWNLVDSSAAHILGEYLSKNGSRKILYSLIKSPSLWDRRIAVVATHAFIRKNDFTDILKLAKLCHSDDQDLMHKAVGWMLRELGKRDKKTLTTFLRKNIKQIPRTSLRYAIERFPESERKRFLHL